MFGPDHILGEIQSEIKETRGHINIAKQRLTKAGLTDHQSLQDLLNLNSYCANLQLLHAKLEPAVRAYKRGAANATVRTHIPAP